MIVARDELDRVARIYLQAVSEGRQPTKAVQESGYPRYTAVRRVSQARQLGLIPPVRTGEHARRNPKALRVANELGVDYDTLVCAIQKHADGDLRLS